MANRRRGEIAATIAGRPFTLCLTLGALAELEDAFGAESLSALAERFGTGRLSAGDLQSLLQVALAGGGCPVPAAEIRAWPAASLPEIVSSLSDLLVATFGDPAPNPPSPQEP